LDRLRNNWLNPPEWTRTETLTFPGSVAGPWARYIEPLSRRAHAASSGVDANSPGVDAGAKQAVGTVRYPRLVPKDAECAKELKKRTLTNLYNQRPPGSTWPMPNSTPPSSPPTAGRRR
jgi:hypothetical protein